ncbi:hypothetical protein DOK76_03975 [Vagococcus sp. DIV0080]|uniref:Uncharacterized protein n=1 Tax=Candidatus Vagococcus giribetii TaxID=2230876 RepID=A0ABS3HR29_9ENTE|nr:hypothetical protein [Vagococcus sp. DIV0080]MBO0476214.1 hypothetical protein [Vagococcus sp. DIV0080]
MINRLFHENLVTRIHVTNLVYILLGLFVLGLLLVTSSLFIKKIVKKATRLTKNTAVYVCRYFGTNLIFLSGGALFVTLILLMTIEQEINLVDYSILVILTYVFASLLSFSLIAVLNKQMYRPKRKRKRKTSQKGLTFQRILLLSCCLQVILYVGSLILFHKHFIVLWWSYLIATLLIYSIGYLIQVLRLPSYQKQKKKKRKKTVPK